MDTAKKPLRLTKEQVAKLRFQCYRCQTEYGQLDEQCPKCGSNIVTLLPPREQLPIDNRNVSPL